MMDRSHYLIKSLKKTISFKRSDSFQKQSLKKKLKNILLETWHQFPNIESIILEQDQTVFTIQKSVYRPEYNDYQDPLGILIGSEEYKFEKLILGAFNLDGDKPLMGGAIENTFKFYYKEAGIVGRLMINMKPEAQVTNKNGAQKEQSENIERYCNTCLTF